MQLVKTIVMYIRTCALLCFYMCNYVRTYILYIVLVFTGLPPLTVNIMKNIESSSIVLQWDAVNDFLPTTYKIILTDEGDSFNATTVTEQTSYIITGLTLDTVYSITVTAANTMCGQGPEFSTSVSFFPDITSTISPTVTASTNPMNTMNPNNTTTTTVVTSSNIITTMNIPITDSMTTTVGRNASTRIF